jgi:hypothetical protein
MRRLICISMAGVALAGLAATMAFGAAPTVVRLEDLVLRIDGVLSPKALPKSELAPVSLHVDVGLESSDGSQPPAIREVVLDSDRNAVVDAEGLPTCKISQVVASSTKAAEAACPGAIVGRGRGTVRVAFPEQEPFYATGPLVVFNAGVEGGATRVLFQIYVDVPAPTAVVTTLTATPEHKGRFGLHSVAKIPVIAGGAGSITHFEMTIGRRFTREGKQHGFLEAQCQDGHFAAVASFRFADGRHMSGDFERPCKVEG